MTKKAESYSDKLKRIYTESEDKRVKLQDKMKVKVKMHVLAAGPEIEPCVVFFRPATTFVKMQCMDLLMQSRSKASATLFESTIIREESDSRVFTQDNDEDYFYMAALRICIRQIVEASDYVKKK